MRTLIWLVALFYSARNLGWIELKSWPCAFMVCAFLVTLILCLLQDLKELGVG